MCGIMLLLRAVLNMLVRNALPRGPMCLGARCLVFSLSGSCELLFFALFHCLLDLSCCECNIIIFFLLVCSVNGYVCLVCCVSDNIFGCGCCY